MARDGNRVRLITRGGRDWSDRFPWIVEAALKNRHPQFVIDGVAVLLLGDGISDFDALHSRRHDGEYAVTYMRMLDADAEGTDWREVARIVLARIANLIERGRPSRAISPAPYG